MLMLILLSLFSIPAILCGSAPNVVSNDMGAIPLRDANWEEGYNVFKLFLLLFVLKLFLLLSSI